jgi:hypothetical protein
MFPSVSGRWRFSDEAFLKDFGEKIKLSEGSLRFS